MLCLKSGLTTTSKPLQEPASGHVDCWADCVRPIDDWSAYLTTWSIVHHISRWLVFDFDTPRPISHRSSGCKRHLKPQTSFLQIVRPSGQAFKIPPWLSRTCQEGEAEPPLCIVPVRVWAGADVLVWNGKASWVSRPGARDGTSHDPTRRSRVDESINFGTRKWTRPFSQLLSSG